MELENIFSVSDFEKLPDAEKHLSKIVYSKLEDILNGKECIFLGLIGEYEKLTQKTFSGDADPLLCMKQDELICKLSAITAYIFNSIINNNLSDYEV